MALCLPLTQQTERSDSSESRYSLMEFMADFPGDATCLHWLWATRYAPDGEHAECPKCETVRPFKRYATSQQRQSWTCTACGTHLHPTAGTFFHKSSTSLHLWFYAMYLMTSTRCGISAKQLERELGVTYKTAWRMFHLIREELMDQDDDTPLQGDVEMDEMFVGGRPRAAGRVAWMGLPLSQNRSGRKEVGAQEEDSRLRHGAARREGRGARRPEHSGDEAWRARPTAGCCPKRSSNTDEAPAYIGSLPRADTSTAAFTTKRASMSWATCTRTRSKGFGRW